MFKNISSPPVLSLALGRISSMFMNSVCVWYFLGGIYPVYVDISFISRSKSTIHARFLRSFFIYSFNVHAVFRSSVLLLRSDIYLSAPRKKSHQNFNFLFCYETRVSALRPDQPHFTPSLLLMVLIWTVESSLIHKGFSSPANISQMIFIFSRQARHYSIRALNVYWM